MVPYRIASVPSCFLYISATKLFYYARKHIYNCIEFCFKPGGVYIHYRNTLNGAYRIASVRSCNLDVCAIKLFYCAKKHMYNCIEFYFTPGGVSIHYRITFNGAL
jgi:hypothetical protein